MRRLRPTAGPGPRGPGSLVGFVSGLAGLFILLNVCTRAGNLAGKKLVPESAGTFKVEGLTFTVLLIGTVVLVGALTFLPALAMGPVVEHFLMGAGSLF